MRDKLEGVRPEQMPGVDLRKDEPVGHLPADMPHEPSPKRMHYVLGWILAAVALVIFVSNLVERTRAVSGHHDALERTSTPERTYVSSVFEPAVIAEFTPSVESGDDTYAARVRILGKDGMEVVRTLPTSCADQPIEARVLRAVRIRVDTWRLRGGGEDRLMSEDDVEAALCGDFAGRDVPRSGTPRADARKKPQPSTAIQVAEEDVN